MIYNFQNMQKTADQRCSPKGTDNLNDDGSAAGQVRLSAINQASYLMLCDSIGCRILHNMLALIRKRKCLTGLIPFQNTRGQIAWCGGAEIPPLMQE